MPHGVGAEKGRTDLETAVHRAVVGVPDDADEVVLAARVDALGLAELPQRGHAALLREVHEHPLEQRGVPGAAVGRDRRHDPAHGHVGVGHQLGEVRGEPGEYVGEGVTGADPPARRDGVHDVPDDPLQALGGPVGGRSAEHQVIGAGETVREDREGRHQDDVDRGAALPGQRPYRPGGRGVDLERDLCDALPEPVPAARHGERPRRLGEIAAPEVQPCLEDPRLRQLALPGGEVGVLDTRAGRGRGRTGAQRSVDVGELCLEHVEGPPVGDDVVQAQHQRGPPLVDRDEPGPHQGFSGEVEGAAPEGLERLGDGGAGAAQVLPLQPEALLWREGDGERARFAADAGAQDVVLSPDQGQRRLQTVRVNRLDRLVEVIGAAQVERRGARIQRLVHPQVLLRRAEPHRPVPVARRHDRRDQPRLPGLHQAPHQPHPLFTAERAEPLGHRRAGRPRCRRHATSSRSSASRCSPASISSRPSPKSTKQATSSQPSSRRSASIFRQVSAEPSRLPQVR